MEAAIGSANGLVRSVLNVLSNNLVEAYVASSQLGLNSKKIKQDLMLAQALLQEAQRNGVIDSPNLQGLLQELTVKADEAEDALDELHYFIIQDQLDGTDYAVPDLGNSLWGHAHHIRHAILHTIGNFVLPCFTCLPRIQDDGDDPLDKLTTDRVAMSKKIKSVMEEIHCLCEPVSELLKITIPNPGNEPFNINRPLMGPISAQETLYGRVDIFEKTIHDITSGRCYGETLSVLPIVGPGGIGKTTFAQHLYNYGRIKEHFAVRVWVCVSTDFDVLKLNQQILSCIQRSNSPNQTTSLEQLQSSIARELKSKRFLIVFDDIWKCDNQDWENLLAPMRKGETKGNMVLITTRFPHIAENVTTDDPIALQGLELVDFLKFFKTQIFGGKKPEYCQEDLDDLAIGIANKLKGSPLAAKTVGRLLRKKFSREHWKRVLENDEWQNQKNNDDIMPSLRISYDYLPFHLKTCFSYFSLFPEDYEFKNLDITYFWIALGIIDKDENYIEELVDNGFLVKKGQYYVMHDLLHELSRNVSAQECLNIRSSSFRVDAIPQTVRHLSVTMEGRYEGDFRVEMVKLRVKIDIGKLRALMIFRKYGEPIDGVLKDMFREIEGLRVLYIVGKTLPLNFSKLVHLRYLKITISYPDHGSEMTLPSTLTRFYHLKFLDLGGCGRYILPKDVSCLINLHHFCVEKELHSNVPSVGKMKCLRELKQFCVKKESVGFELGELGELTELGGKLSIHNLEKVATKEEAMKANLVYKRDLKKLRLVWGTDHQYSTEYDVLDALQPHHNLGALSIINHGAKAGPSWLCRDSSLRELGSLHLEGVSWDTLPPFGELLHLTSLKLINISVLREIKPGVFGVTDKSFEHLKRIVLGNLPEFIEWVGGANVHSFARLEYISCIDCPNLCAVPFLECSVSYTNLTKFHIVGCPNLALPPMPHRSTLTVCHVTLASTELIYEYGYMRINGYSGELAWHNLHEVELMRIRDVSHISITELNKLKSLTKLHISRCVVRCGGLQDLTCLQSLTVRDCGNFFRWAIEAGHTNKPFPASLGILEIKGEPGLQSMAQLSNLTRLTRLELVDCENLKLDAGFNPLFTTNLKELAVYNSGLRRSISADLFSELVEARTNLSFPAGSFRLEELEVDCIAAVLVAPICSLLAATLKILKFIHDPREERFTEEEDRALQLLTSLTSIEFSDCSSLPSVPQGLHNFPCLWHLHVFYCPQIRSLPKEAFPTSLMYLCLKGCSPELQEQAEKLKGTEPGFWVSID